MTQRCSRSAGRRVPTARYGAASPLPALGDRSMSDPVPRVAAATRSRVRDVKFPAQHNRTIKITVPGLSPCRSGRKTISKGRGNGARLRRGRERRNQDLFAAGADIVQIDPYMQRGGEAKIRFEGAQFNDGVRHHGVHFVSATPCHPRRRFRFCLAARPAGIDRDRATGSSALALPGKPSSSVLDLSDMKVNPVAAHARPSCPRARRGARAD